MPRLKNRCPPMTRNRNTAIVCIDGQTIRLGPWASPQADEGYRLLIAEWMQNGRRLPPPAHDTEEAPEVSVAEICVGYVRYANGRYTPSEAQTIRAAVRHVRALYGTTAAPPRVITGNGGLRSADRALSTVRNGRHRWSRANACTRKTGWHATPSTNSPNRLR